MVPCNTAEYRSASLQIVLHGTMQYRRVPHCHIFWLGSLLTCHDQPTCVCRPDRYVPIFGQAVYDVKLERAGDIPFEEQLRGLEQVIKAGKVGHGGGRG